MRGWGGGGGGGRGQLAVRREETKHGKQVKGKNGDQVEKEPAKYVVARDEAVALDQGASLCEGLLGREGFKQDGTWRGGARRVEVGG